ncbi:IS3 family transposase [Corynebacterium striatum]|uniref:IS3 family transposase n=1 Tax=Corynebacterium striatum TaxID=43770 RepID=UPI003B597AA8
MTVPPTRKPGTNYADYRYQLRRTGNCYDNAVMENFFGHLKAEMYHGEKFGSVKEFTAAVDAYIDWYNAERLQLGLDGCTPMKYRDKALKTLAG